jgi:hypothetical protein
MRKRILIVQNAETMSPVIREALDGGAFDLKWLSGLSDVVASVQEHKPALVLFEISRWQKPMEQLLFELMNLKYARLTRKVILSDSGGGRQGNRTRIGCGRLPAEAYLSA